MKKVPFWQLKNELQGIIMIGFSLVIFKLYVSKNISMILAPKMLPFILFAMISLFIMGFFRLLNSDLYGADCDCDVCDTSTSPLASFLQYGLFIIPILLALVISDFSINNDVLVKKGLSTFSFNNSEQIMHIEEMEKTISVTDDNYFQVMELLNTKIDKMVGKEIVISGFIYREVSFRNMEAVIARQSMACCIADSSVYGYMLEGDIRSLQTDRWYEIIGTLVKGTYKGEVMPKIKVRQAKNITPPFEQYLYE